MNKLFYRLMTIVLVCFAMPCKTQFFKRMHARHNEHPPKAILVELPTETNRVAYFIKKGKRNKVQYLLDANKKVRRVMIADFADNFTFCPVYFFNDSSIELVKDKKLVGVLLDKKMQPATNIILSTADTDYFIVYYGTETAEDVPENAKYDPYNTSYTGSTIPNLVAMSYNYKKLAYGLPDRTRYNHFSQNMFVPKYSYELKEFDISYNPLAYYYSRTLEKYYKQRKK